ncbi:hypothetical protein HZH66_010495 [Vespula vulgaris]|uniref:Uncharacterized protein n=1 Tax=Vespula vulgaris TaxID=7454 RepID=A0A834N072_VESVU|nr:hypothetical protein HZH66_010495 [Vespula vulgaris]
MGAIDHQNQMLPIWLNTYIMHKTLHSQRKEKCVNYRLNIAEVIVQNVQLPNYKKRGKSALGETTLPQVQYWAHLPKQIDLTPQKKKPTRMCKIYYKHKI